MLTKIKNIISLLEKESYVFLGFIALSLVVNGNKKYFVLLLGYALFLYLVSGNLVRAFWLAFVSAFLFDKVVVLLINYPVTETVLHQLPNKEVTMNFAFAFADALLIPFIFFIRKKSVKIQWGIIDGVVLVLFVLGIISAINSTVPFYYSWYALFKLFIYILIFYLAREIGKDKRIVKATLEIIVLYALFNVVLMLLQKVHGGPLGLLVEDMTYPFGRYADEISSLYRPGGISWNANLTGTILLMVVPLSLVAQKLRQYPKWVSGVMTLFLLLGIYLTASRFIWLATFLAVGVYLYKYPEEIKKLLGKMNKLLKTLLCIGGIVLLAPFVISRLSTLTEKNGYYYRYQQYLTAVDMIKNRLFGVGLDGYRYFAVDNYLPKDYGYNVTPPHNLFLEVGSGVGIGGVICLVLLLFIICRKFIYYYRARKWELPVGLCSALVVYFLVNQAYTSWYSASMTKLFWLLLGLAYVDTFKETTT